MPRGKNQDFFNNLMPKAKFQTFQCLIFYREGLLTIYGDTDIALSEQLKCQLNYLIFSAFYGNLEITRAHAFGKIKGDLRCLPSAENAFQYTCFVHNSKCLFAQAN